MKFRFNSIVKSIKRKRFKNFFSQENINYLFDDEDYIDCLYSFLCLAIIISQLLKDKDHLEQILKNKQSCKTLKQDNSLEDTEVHAIQDNYELIIDYLKHDLEQQKSFYLLDKENLQIEISNLEENQKYLKQQLIEQFNVNSDYEDTIDILNQKNKEQLEQLELSRSSLNVIENKVKSLEEQLEIARLQSSNQSNKLEVDVMNQKDKIKLDDSLSAYIKLVEEKDLLLNQATEEILELKNDLYEQKKQFSETSKQYEEEIEQLRQENVYYKNLRDTVCNFEKIDEISKEEINTLKHELQATVFQLEGIKASSEVEEIDEIESIRQQLVQKIEETVVLQDVIENQKKEIFELRSLLVEDGQESDSKAIDKTLEHLKKKLQEVVDEASLFYDETLLE